MGFNSIWHWIIVLVIILLLFGAGKVPRLMGDLAKGVKAFKAGLREDEPAAPAASTEAPKQLDAEHSTVVVEKDPAAKH
jgi:sec-independent protein translocase protein TatA